MVASLLFCSYEELDHPTFLQSWPKARRFPFPPKLYVSISLAVGPHKVAVAYQEEEMASVFRKTP